MTRRSGGLFAGRGIALPGLAVTVVTVIVAFALGLGTGWLSGYVPDAYRAWREGPSPSPSPSVSASPEVDVSLPPLEPITRELDEDDAAAGVVTTAVVTRGAGTFTSVPGVTAEVDDAGPVRYVRIDVEDGVTLDNEALVDYVMTTLNDPRGWGSAGRLQFVLTEGAADIRIVFASPHTVVSRCPDPHIPATLSGGSATPEPSASATPVPSASASPAVTGAVVPFDGNRAHRPSTTGPRDSRRTATTGRSHASTCSTTAWATCSGSRTSSASPAVRPSWWTRRSRFPRGARSTRGRSPTRTRPADSAPLAASRRGVVRGVGPL